MAQRHANDYRTVHDAFTDALGEEQLPNVPASMGVMSEDKVVGLFENWDAFKESLDFPYPDDFEPAKTSGHIFSTDFSDGYAAVRVTDAEVKEEKKPSYIKVEYLDTLSEITGVDVREHLKAKKYGNHPVVVDPEGVEWIVLIAPYIKE